MQSGILAARKKKIGGHQTISHKRAKGADVKSYNMSPDCVYLGKMVHLAPDVSGFRIGGFGEPYCILMAHLPCPEKCPDRKAMDERSGNPRRDAAFKT